MQSLRDSYIVETLARAEAKRHRRTRAPGDEGPRRGLSHSAAGFTGRLLIGLGAWLLAYGGERARVYLAPHPAPPVPHKN